MSGPKLHHYVPQAYLARFGAGDQVKVRRRPPGATHLSNVKNVAAETGFYTVTDTDGNPSLVVEQGLSDLENDGLQAIRRIDETGVPPAIESDDRETLCVYLAVQMARTPRQRTAVLFPNAVETYADGHPVDRAMVAEYLEQRHLGSTPTEAEVEGAWTFIEATRSERGGNLQTQAVVVTLGSIAEFLPHFRARHWRLEVCRKPAFLTSDAPLVIWWPPSVLDNHQGGGLVNAAEIRFPLDPYKQLVLVPGVGGSVQDVRPSRATACNQDLADGCERVIVGHPDRHARLKEPVLNERGPVLRFNMAPLLKQRPDGSLEPSGQQALHLWTTRR